MNTFKGEVLRVWDYTVSAGDTLQDDWLIDDFQEGKYHLRAYGPNGFFREFAGMKDASGISVKCSYEKANAGSGWSGNLIVQLHNTGSSQVTVNVEDLAYKTAAQSITLAAGGHKNLVMNLSKSYNWYDFKVSVQGNENFMERFAGRVETGKEGKTDPLMGGVI